MRTVWEDKVEKADEKIIMGNGARCNKGLKKKTKRSLKRKKRKIKTKERELDRRNERGKEREGEGVAAGRRGRRINAIARENEGRKRHRCGAGDRNETRQDERNRTVKQSEGARAGRN